MALFIDIPLVYTTFRPNLFTWIRPYQKCIIADFHTLKKTQIYMIIWLTIQHVYHYPQRVNRQFSDYSKSWMQIVERFGPFCEDKIAPFASLCRLYTVEIYGLGFTFPCSPWLQRQTEELMPRLHLLVNLSRKRKRKAICGGGGGRM